MLSLGAVLALGVLLGPVHAAQGAAVQAVLAMMCTPHREGGGCQVRFPAGEQPGWPQLCAGDTSTPTLQCWSLIFDNTSPHLKQEISCALERTQADSAVDRPAPDARKGQSHTVTAAWCCAAGLAMVRCCLSICLPLRKSID